MRIMAVDPGSKHIGIAISDETCTIANPLTVIEHVSRAIDSAAVIEIAESHDVVLIIMGQSFDDLGHPSFEGRRAARFAGALRKQTDIPIKIWDESFTTQDARAAQIAMDVKRKHRAGHLDQLAATVLLQSFLDSQASDSKKDDDKGI